MITTTLHTHNYCTSAYLRSLLLLFFLSLSCILTAQPSQKNYSKKEYKDFSVFELDSLIQLQQQAGNIKNAIELAEYSLEIAEKEYGKEEREYANSIVKLSGLYYYIGEVRKTISLMQTARDIYQKVSGYQSNDYAITTANFAMLLQKAGNYDEAETHLLEAKEIFENIPDFDSTNYAIALNSLGMLYIDQMKFEQAKGLLEVAKDYINQLFPPNHPFIPGLENNVGIVYHQTKDYDKAEKAFENASQLYGELFGEKHPMYATALGNLAAVYVDQKKYEQAEALFKKTLSIQLKVNGKLSDLYIDALIQQGKLYIKSKRWDKATATLQEALKLSTDLYGNQHPRIADLYKSSAIIYQEKNQFEDAIRYYLKSLETNNSQDIQLNMTSWSGFINNLQDLDPFSPTINIEILTELQKCLRLNYDVNQNKQLLQQAFDLANFTADYSLRVRNEFGTVEDKVEFMSKFSRLIESSLRTILLMDDSDSRELALRFAEQNKALLIADALKAKQARSVGGLPIELKNREEELSSSLDEYRKQIHSSFDPSKKMSLQKEINAKVSALDQFKKEIKEDYPKYYSLKYEDITTTSEAIRQQLTKQQLFLEFVVVEEQIFLLLIHADGHELHQITVDYKKLQQAIRQMRKGLSDYSFIKSSPQEARQIYIENASWLYEKLLKKVLEGSTVQELIIVPDGELGHLPFEAFLTSPVTSTSTNYVELPYLLKSYKVSYNYSATLWKENLGATTGSASQDLLACAASYQAKDSAHFAISRGPILRNLRSVLQDLPAARQEVQELASNFSGKFLIGLQANEQQFKELAGDYAVIHLAMHGLLNTKHPILSSLAFTENGDSTEDNFLQAYEISQMELNAQLVVLSACETGYGKFQQGEGVMSLARSFMYAGVPSLVVSLWQVNDQSTSLIMQLFYTNLAKGMDKAEALQQAKLSYIESVEKPQAAHPAYWAPFIQLGDSRPVKLATKSSNSWIWWMVGAGGLLLLGLGIGLAKRKQAA